MDKRPLLRVRQVAERLSERMTRVPENSLEAFIKRQRFRDFQHHLQICRLFLGTGFHLIAFGFSLHQSTPRFSRCFSMACPLPDGRALLDTEFIVNYCNNFCISFWATNINAPGADFHMTLFPSTVISTGMACEVPSCVILAIP